MLEILDTAGTVSLHNASHAITYLWSYHLTIYGHDLCKTSLGCLPFTGIDTLLSSVTQALVMPSRGNEILLKYLKVG